MTVLLPTNTAVVLAITFAPTLTVVLTLANPVIVVPVELATNDVKKPSIPTDNSLSDLILPVWKAPVALAMNAVPTVTDVALTVPVWYAPVVLAMNAVPTDRIAELTLVDTFA